MPPLRLPSDSGSESDVPETISLSQSKNSIKKQNAEIHKAGVLAREKIKLKNREKDQRLKKRAVLNQKEDKVYLKHVKKGKEAAVDEGREKELMNNRAEARMSHAMKDAEEEGNEDGDLDDGKGFTEFQEGSSSDDEAAMDEDEDSAEGFDDPDLGSDEDEYMNLEDIDSV